MNSDSCRLRTLRVYNFRNYSEQTVEFDPGLNVVTGVNAQGKTNLLEAIASLVLTRSPRASTASELLQWGTNEALVSGFIQRPAGDISIEMRLARNDAEGRVTRTVTVDNKPRPAKDIVGLCPVVTFSPDDLQLVKGGPEGRRKRLDLILCQLDPRAAADLSKYRRVLEQRNALLRQLKIGAAQLSELDGFTIELARYGASIRVARAQLVEALCKAAAEALVELNSHEVLKLEYLAHGNTVEADNAEEVLLARLRSLQSEEMARGQTLVGPHRDDVNITLNDRPGRTTASQGQQRSIVLAIALAEVRHIRNTAGMAPILLLDDVLSELDSTRRQQLLTTVANTEGLQVVVTTSEADVVDKMEVVAGRLFTVSNGAVQTAATMVG